MAKKITTIQCKCCKKRVAPTHIQTVLGLLPFHEFRDVSSESYVKNFQETISRYPSFYQWACDTCIKKGKAIKARPSKQLYTFNYPWDAASPFLAYYDISFTCKTCKTDFTFSKEEQRFWYEDLQFVVYSKPLNCRACRANIRAGKSLNAELSQLLKEGKPDNVEDLERIAEIYATMGKVEKVKAYRKAAQKLKAKR